jgi:peptide/nickel transport system substrate-binding protein
MSRLGEKSAWRLLATMALLSVALPASALEYKQSPTLDAAVAAGELPPVEERLPKDPEIVEPFESIGTYGGTFQFGISGAADQEQVSYWTGNQGLVRQDPATNFSSIIPNLAASFEIDPEGKVFTFHLREGVKWSDGTPFTADDIAFNMEDLVLNPDWAPMPKIYSAGGAPVKFRKIDDFTVEFSFDNPYGLFLHELADRRYLDHVFYQKAHCSQFHPKYNPDLDALLSSAGTTDWRTLMVQECGDVWQSPARFANPDRPVLEAWIVKEGYTASSSQVVLERNPYFWMVDSEGNQLPYIDTVIGTIYSDPQALLLGAIGGNVDFQFRHLSSSANRPVLAENAEKGGYELYEVTPIGGSPAVINLNLTHKDPEYRELFNNKDFRIALSVGMDRQEIIDTVLLGAGQPWQNAPYEDSPMYHERYATQFIEHDVAKANELLDGLGLTRGADGIRTLESGRPLIIRTQIPPAPPEISDMLEILALQWERIGVRLDVSVVERSIMFANVDNNDHDMAAWEDHASWLPGRLPTGMIPLEFDSRWAIAWADWYKSEGAKGEEPPESIKQRIALYEESKSSVTFEERKALYDQIADIAADEFEVFAVTKHLSTYGIKKTDLRNVRPSNPGTSQYPPSLMLPWSWYWGE